MHARTHSLSLSLSLARPLLLLLLLSFCLALSLLLSLAHTHTCGNSFAKARGAFFAALTESTSTGACSELSAAPPVVFPPALPTPPAFLSRKPKSAKKSSEVGIFLLGVLVDVGHGQTQRYILNLSVSRAVFAGKDANTRTNHRRVLSRVHSIILPQSLSHTRSLTLPPACRHLLQFFL